MVQEREDDKDNPGDYERGRGEREKGALVNGCQEE